MEWGMSFIKYSLFVFNLIFAVSGVILIVAGAAILGYIFDFNYFINGRILAPPMVLMATGLIVFAVTFLGCYGSIKESYKLLMAFAFALLGILIIELSIGIAGAVLKSDFETAMKNTMRSSMVDYQRPEELAWEKVQKGFSCCGIDSPQDWVDANTKKGAPSDVVPNSCCKNFRYDNGCKTSEESGDHSPTKKGCWDSLSGRMKNSASVLIGVGIGIALIEIVGIVYACCLASTIKREAEAK